MSAREMLTIETPEHWSTEMWGRFVDTVLATHRNEVLRKAAEEIRATLPETVKERLADGIFSITHVPTAKQAADLIDPEVES